MSLRKRIAAAVIAIAVIHLAFYAGPRWWYGRARVYREAYDEATGIIEEQFGEKAVADGVVSIPDEPVSVPYKGQTLWDNSNWWPALNVFIGGPDGDSWVVFGREVRGCALEVTAARTSWQRARGIAAVFAYLDRVRVETGEPASPGGPDQSPMAIADLTGPVQQTAKMREALRVVTAPDLEFTGARDVVVKALGDIVRASLPPRSDADFFRLTRFLARQRELAGKESLESLKRIEALVARQAARPPVLYRIPFLGKAMKIRDERTAFLRSVWEHLPYEIWAIESGFEARPEEEQTAFLLKMAFPGPSAAPALLPDYAARDLLERRYPEALANYYAEHYADTKGREDRNPLVHSRAEWIDMPGVRRLLRLVAADGSSAFQPEACMLLYLATSHGFLITTLKKTAKEETFTNETRAVEALRGLAEIYGLDSGAFDAAAFYRELLSEMTRPRPAPPGAPFSTPPPVDAAGHWVNIDREVFHVMTDRRDAAFLPLLDDCLNSPEKVFRAEAPVSSYMRELRRYAAEALGRYGSAEAAEILIRHLSRFRLTEGPDLARAAIRSLGSIGRPEALPVLEGLRDDAIKVREEAQKGPPSGVYMGESLPDDLDETIRLLELKSASDPVSYYLEALDNRPIPLNTRALHDVMSAEQLKALLADDKCRTPRAIILWALVSKNSSEARRGMESLAEKPSAPGPDKTEKGKPK